MSPHYSIQISEPDSVKLTLTVTMTAKEWKELRKQLAGGSWPAPRFSEAINDMVRQSERFFFPTEESAS